MKNPVATIEMESGNSIQIELYPEMAPNTVNNFISLINKQFYNGTKFHRVIENFMIQGGDPLGNGMGDPGYSIKGEFSLNNIRNDLLHTRGVISMARSENPDSAGSQFFIMHKDAPHLNGAYAAFGKVIDGMEEVDRIALVRKNYLDKPLKDEVIKKISVELNNYKFVEPIRIL